MILHFYLRFSTQYGQAIFISGNTEALGNDDPQKAMPIQYLNEEYWHGVLNIEDDEPIVALRYKYILRDANGEVIEWGDDRVLEPGNTKAAEWVMIDTWNHAGNPVNTFFTQPFQEVLLSGKTTSRQKLPKTFTHEFRVKAPLLQDHEVICMTGSGNLLGEWQTETPHLAVRVDNWWVIRLNLAKEKFPIAYKYGVYNTNTETFTQFEGGNNRILMGEVARKTITIIHDGFAQLSPPSWRGAGVAIPVFSLRTKNGFGTGEFADIRQLVDWAHATGLKLIQLLPINDTTAHHSEKDSYPYAAISAFALHPLYLNLDKVAGKEHADLIKSLRRKQKQLNESPTVDYDQVMRFKNNAIKDLYKARKTDLHDNPDYFSFFELNRHWLVPYAAFSYLRDKYKTADFSQWKTHSRYDENQIQKLVSPTQKHYDAIAIYYFTQYHLHLQLKEATNYAHKKGIIVKGDLPIGIYRHSCDAWVSPDLYNMDAQAGAPPDDFAVKGQNWGFPTYNWKRMQEDGFAWWRRRFEQMSNYFDAFRIDHILGFFRIWSIPLDAVEGVMGRFNPAIPVHLNEFFSRGIAFDRFRYCKPYISDEVLGNLFGDLVQGVKDQFIEIRHGMYHLKTGFETQRDVEAYFAELATTDVALQAENDRIKYGLFDLISNVILFEEPGQEGQAFHFRIAMEQTSSFQHLDGHAKEQLKALYINYFFSRQDHFWEEEAMRKLPSLKRSTNMLICGEDLGMVPGCVNNVMQQLGILGLEIQRMPKQTGIEFVHPAAAPYLSVITPATHDMSTIRGWWEEDRAKTQRFYNQILGHYGEAPYFCEPWVNKEIVLQHLYSPAMWSIFQIQDILGSSETLRRENPEDERINKPDNPKHYWCYRMHIGMEDLLKATDFNEELRHYVAASGRA
jgi:4-alpha-glucanotransferase